MAKKTVKGVVLLTALGFLAIITFVPGTVSFSQQQGEEQAATMARNNNTNTSDRNEQSLISNNTQSGGINQTATTTVSVEEQRSMLARSFRENMTSGETKVIMIVMSRQAGVPVQQELRDNDPLGLITFADGTTTMQVEQPDYASGENLTSTLYTGGQLSFMFENLTIPPPDDIDVVFLSENADDMRSPIVVDDAGFDNEFVVPQGLRNNESYLVLVSMHWPELGQDVLMGIDSRAINLSIREGQQ